MWKWSYRALECSEWSAMRHRSSTAKEIASSTHWIGCSLGAIAILGAPTSAGRQSPQSVAVPI
jgi:hypothetical protein